MKIGVIGTGRMAERHLGVLTAMPGVIVVGHVSHSAERANVQATHWGGRAHTDVSAMLERERPDAVWLCVLPDRHGGYEEALIAHATPFFVEKPLAAESETPRHIAALLAVGSVITGVGYKFRAMCTAPRIRELLVEQPARLMIGAWHGSTPTLPWWQNQAQSGGQIVEQVTHLVDTARFFVGEGEVVAARAAHHPRAAFPDCTIATMNAALLQFEGNLPMTLTATCLLDRSHALSLQFICERRVLTVNDKCLLIEDVQGVEEVPVRGDLFQIEDEAFVRAVRERDPRFVLSTYTDALRTHELCVAISRSSFPP